MSAQIGQVSEVTGSNIKASMDATQLAAAQSGGGSASVTVGSMVEVQSGGSRVLGMVSAIRSPGMDKGAIMDISLVGQFVSNASGGSEFRRGVARWPAIGSPVVMVTDTDAASVVKTTSTSTVHIGKAEFNGTQDIYLDVDNLLRTHFAIFGSSGSGKTSTTAVILRAILQRLPNAHMILLDPHNEYEGAFAGMTERLTLSTLRLPYWMLRFQEMCAVFKVLPEGEYASEVKILREAIVQAKTLYAGMAVAATAAAAKPGQSAIAPTSSLNLDSPVPFRLSDFRRIVNDMMGKLDNPEAIQSYLRILNRLEELTTDDRYGFMFGPQFVRDVMGEVICQLTRIPVDGKPITTIDLSDIPEEIVDVVVSVVFRTIFSFAVWSGEEGAVPTVLVCEEAHRYLWDDRSGKTISLAVHAAGQVAKEGRKYGVGLGVISQRPSEVSPSIVSQCGTIITLRLGNERDLAFVKNALPDSAAGLMQALPALNTREAIVFGQGVAFPTRLTVNELPAEARPRQKVKSFMEAWSTDSTDTGLVSRTIERWRQRVHQIREGVTEPFVRKARQEDLPAIVAMLADDALGRTREDAGPLNPLYAEAFARVERDPNQFMAVLEDRGEVVGYLQLTFIPGLSMRGMVRGQIESVRIASSRRRDGLGRRMLEWAITECRRRDCGMVQLTMNKSRGDVLRFYESLGFVASHEGFKLALV